MSTTNQQTSTITIGPVRLSYVHLWEPYAGKDGSQKPKYQISAIVSKKDKAIIDKINSAIEVAKQIGKEKKWNNKIPPVLAISFEDGDKMKPDDPAYKDSFYISAKSTSQPLLIDKHKNKITEKDELYSGCYGYININWYPYKDPKNGIACGLNIVMKTKDGDALGGGRVTADEAFDGVEIEEEDFSDL